MIAIPGHANTTIVTFHTVWIVQIVTYLHNMLMDNSSHHITSFKIFEVCRLKAIELLNVNGFW